MLGLTLAEAIKKPSQKINVWMIQHLSRTAVCHIISGGSIDTLVSKIRVPTNVNRRHL